MENVFEFRFTDQKETLYEYYRAVGGMRLKSLIIVLTAVIAVAVVACILKVYSILVLMIAIALVCGFFYCYPYIAANSNLSAISKQCGGQIPETAVRFDEKIELTEAGEHTVIDYEKILAAMPLKRSFVLMLGKSDGIILPMECFTEESFQAFKEFLEGKCPDLTI